MTLPPDVPRPNYGHASGGSGGLAPPPPPPQSVERPNVVKWFTLYAVMMSLLYLSIAGFGIAIFVVGADRFADARHGAGEWVVNAITCVVTGLVLCVPFALAPFLPRRPGVWVYDLVLICLGLSSPCCLPITIPLLIHWIKSETKLWFGRTA